MIRRELLRLGAAGAGFRTVTRAQAARSGSRITGIKIHQPAGLLRIAAEGDVEGYCLQVGPAAAATIDRVFRPVLMNRDALDRERLWREMLAIERRLSIQPAARAAVDIALWDLSGKLLHEPAFRVAGGFRDRIPGYLCGSRLSKVDAVVAEAVAARARGLAGYKHRLDGGTARIGDVAAALREAVGPTFALMHSGARGYHETEALRVGRTLDRYGFYWFEEPLRDPAGPSLKRLAQALDVAVTGAVEASDPLKSAARMLAGQSIDTVRLQPFVHGGITDMLKVARAAEAFGVNVELAPETPLEEFAAVQVQAAIRNSDFFELRTRAASALVKTSLLVESGNVRVPRGEGLGFELDWPEVERQTARVL